ncbi:PKD domain-containing protein [Geobacter pelophilus]|uniref:PKD domain-containing protein n=1 Tax=Geoanaerobacter pelophilus TaxID=60036 RepID=A0AAW4L4X8_9BACT|nr:PKD domain-containing protein [Geoanaerobacter pelophilus]MBT0666061.1 PKD domain-containing protein [Geoanaerobacter pelophilus]
MKGNCLIQMLLSFAILLILPKIAFAGPMSWNITSGGAWETTANWAPSKLPARGDDVDIRGAGGNSITFDSTVTIGSLKISGNSLSLRSGQITISPEMPPPPPQFSLAVVKSGTGSGNVTSSPSGINCGSVCTAAFDQNRSITLTATAEYGSLFTGWSNGSCSGTGNCTIAINGNTGVIATFASQASGLTAAFSSSHAAPYAGQSIQFTDQSTGTPVSWEWNFGDGTTSTVQNPTHTFLTANSYTVTLKVTNAGGASNTTTKTVTVTSTGSTFLLMSDAGSNGGNLPIYYTIDGSGASPALAWVNPPQGTTNYALVMTTLPGDGTTLYNWVLYNIPDTSVSLARNNTAVGTAGKTSHTVLGYAPPQSTGPGSKAYTLTLYALSGTPSLPADPSQVTGDLLTTAIANITLGSSSLSLSYARTAPEPGFSWQAADTAIIFTNTSGLSATSWLWDFGDGATATNQSPIHTYHNYGTYQVTLTVGNEFGSSSITKTITVASTAPMGMNNVQTISDGAQRTTLAFSAFAMMNGNLNSQSFFPPGKVADYTGFQYLRDNDLDGMGHNTSFLTRVAENVIYILSDEQFRQLTILATAQQADISSYGYGRFKLMKAFRHLLSGDIPSGSTGLSLDAVKSVSRQLYLIDGKISYDRALLYANVLNGMSSSQKAYLEAMKGKGWASWPDTSIEGSAMRAEIQRKMGTLLRQYGGDAVAVMTYAGDLFSWYAGSIEADVYFCPERQGTYYGGFYMKDAPAIGHEGYAISTSLTADVGTVLSDSTKGYVTETQAALMSGLVDTQRNNLYAGSTSIVSIRLQIATLLRKLLITSDTDKSIFNQVMSLSGTYGDLDGENNYNYATVFANVYQSLGTMILNGETIDQKAKITALYSSIMKGNYTDTNGNIIGTYDFSGSCPAPFLYSAPLAATDSGFVANTSDTAVYPLFGLTAP